MNKENKINGLLGLLSTYVEDPDVSEVEIMFLGGQEVTTCEGGNIPSYKIIDQSFLRDHFKKIVNQYWEDELKHWKEITGKENYDPNNSDNHIINSLWILKQYTEL